MFRLYAGLAAMALALGAWWYVDNLQMENEILTLNNAKQSDALNTMAETLATRELDIEVKQEQVARKQKQLQSLREVNQKLNGELNEIPECMGVVPGDDFINKLREYTRGQDSNQV